MARRITVDSLLMFEGAALEAAIKALVFRRSYHRQSRRTATGSSVEWHERREREASIALRALLEARRLAKRAMAREVARMERIADELAAQQAADPEAPDWAFVA